MSKIVIRGVIHLNDGKVEELKKFSQKVVTQIREIEPRTLAHDWYISEDGKTCYVNEIYGNSDDVLTHMQNMAPLMAEGMALGTIELEVLGDASAELKVAVAELKPKYYTPIALL